MRFLLDTNVLSEPVKPQPDQAVLRKLQQWNNQLCTAAPVWNELLFGLFRLPDSKKRQGFSRYLREVLEPGLMVLPYDARAADWHAWERARLGRLGQTPAFVDGQIAAVARTHGLTLVTRNVRDFSAFEELEVVDWSSG